MGSNTLTSNTMRTNTTPSRTRIKICGITQLSDALLIAEQGADSIGLVFHPQSPRFIGLDTARKIRDAMPPFVTITMWKGVFNWGTVLTQRGQFS